MARFWFKSVVFAALVTFIFAGLTTLRVGDGVGHRAAAVAVLGNMLHSAFVKPFGLPMTLVGVAILTLGFCGFFALNLQASQQAEAPSGLEGAMAGKLAFLDGRDGIGSTSTKGDLRAQSRMGANSFGRKHAEPSTEPVAPVPKTVRLTDPAQIVLQALKGKGFDWYMAHQGYEGNWRQAHAGLLALGYHRQAEILAKAGECYDRYIRDVFTPADGEPSSEDDQKYMDEMQAFDREWIAANPLRINS